MSLGRTSSVSLGGDLPQQAISDFVAQALVDQLEAIQVQEEQGRGPPRALRRRERQIEAIYQELAVGKAGERVVEGEACELELAAHALDRVADAPREQAAVDLATR